MLKGRILVNPWRYKRAVQAIQRFGGLVTYLYEWDLVSDKVRRPQGFERLLLSLPVCSDFLKVPILIFFSDCRFPIEAVEYIRILGEARQLRFLNISNSNITPETLVEVVQSLPELQHVCFNCTAANDRVCEALCLCSNLEIVALLETSVTKQGVDMLAARFPGVNVGWTEDRENSVPKWLRPISQTST